MICLILIIKNIAPNKIIQESCSYQSFMHKNESISKTSQYYSQDQSKTFPLIPDQIHKVPESIRKAIKIGKHRKNLNINLNNNPKLFNNEPNDEWIESVKMEGRRDGGLHVRQIFGFMGGSVANEDETDKYLEEEQSVKDVAKFFKSEANKNKVSGDRILYARKKLTPLKKGLTVQPRSIVTRDKRNFKVTFLNVEKLELVKMYNNLDKQKTDITNKTAMNLAISMGGKNKLIENFLQSTGLSTQNAGARRSFYDKSTTKLKLKPFSPPFQRYYYRDFIWKCAFSYSIFHESPQVYEQKFKVFIGRGNNSMLLKSLIKRRKSWWTFTDRYDEANFIWTQIKINVVFSNQKNQKSIYQQKQQFCPEDKPKNSLTAANKLNLKILNEHECSHWIEYFSKFRRAEDLLDETMKKRNKVFTNDKNKLTCKNLTQLDLKSLRIHNHLPNNYIISNKKALYYTMSKYYQKIKQDVFEYLPLTFHIQNGLEDPQYLKFLNSYYQRAKKIRAREKNQNSDSPMNIEKEQENQPQSPQSPSRVSVQNMWIVKPGQFTNRGNGITVCMNLQQIKAILKRKQRHDNGNYKTYIIQSYLEKPFLYQKRKFDLRHYMMITSINGIVKGYWYQLGYIRTTSFQYTTKHGFTSVHLTNDAVQKFLPEYGKYQKGNKISYEQFQKYLQKQHGAQYNFYEQVYPKMKKIATDSIKACSLMIDPEKKGHNFEVFGMDFMIDGDFHPWLIQINNNPCLQLSCPLLGEIIPPMVQNCLKICLDSLIPPPVTLLQKRSKLTQNMLQTNKFELVYDSSTEQKQMLALFNGNYKLDLDYKELEKDQDEVFDDDGLELDD